jgi:hypothetical protein
LILLVLPFLTLFSSMLALSARLPDYEALAAAVWGISVEGRIPTFYAGAAALNVS